MIPRQAGQQVRPVSYPISHSHHLISCGSIYLVPQKRHVEGGCQIWMLSSKAPLKRLSWARLVVGVPQGWVSIHVQFSSSGNSVLANKNFGHAKSSPYTPQDIKKKVIGFSLLWSSLFLSNCHTSHRGPSWVSLMIGKPGQLEISIDLFEVGSFKIPLSQGNSLEWNAGKNEIWYTLWLVYPSASSLVHVSKVSPLLGYDLSGFCSLFKATLQWLFRD